MNVMIIYRPFKTQLWPIFFTIPVGVLSFLAAGFCIRYCGLSVIVLVSTGIVCAWLTKVLYESSNMVVSFEQEGVRIIGSRYKDYRYVHWKEVSYAYYARSFKGHLFLVLSPKALSPKETKKFVNRAANSSKICIDCVLVIYIDALQDTTQISEQIINNVLYVDTY